MADAQRRWVDHHLEAVFAELGVGSRTQAATVAVTTGPLETCRQPQSED
jgi:DNA-binding NarL/FixJ family response regulator